MKIVIAPDSFKGSISSVEASVAMECGIHRVFPNAEIIRIPLADGGEGTMAVLLSVLGGKIYDCIVSNPLRRDVAVSYGIIDINGEKTAVIEVAAASGLTLVCDNEKNALRASSYGTGQLIFDALEKGCRNFIIGLGGSATTDAGKGVLEALGVKFYDENNELLSDGGGSLISLSRIDTSEMDIRLHKCKFRVISDVENMLYGEKGAAHVFGPQKGASVEDVSILDKGLKQFAKCVKACLDFDVSLLRGGGAAGGIGAALVSFCNAEIMSGAEFILTLTGFCEKIKDADFILTGEGKIDSQTLMGKLLSCVLDKALILGIPVYAFAGIVENKAMLLKSGFKEICGINPQGESLINVMNKNIAINNLEKAVYDYFKEYKNVKD